MRWMYLSLALLGWSLTTAVQASWMDNSIVDRLTGRKIFRMESKSRTSVTVYGHAVSPSLVIQCVRSPDTDPTLGFFIVFPQVVGFSDTQMRYRFDDGPAESNGVGASRQGTYYQVITMGSFGDALRTAKRLRIDLQLPQSNAFLDFDTTNAGAAFEKVSCR